MNKLRQWFSPCSTWTHVNWPLGFTSVKSPEINCVNLISNLYAQPCFHSDSVNPPSYFPFLYFSFTSFIHVSHTHTHTHKHTHKHTHTHTHRHTHTRPPAPCCWIPHWDSGAVLQISGSWPETWGVVLPLQQIESIFRLFVARLHQFHVGTQHERAPPV